MDLILKDGTVLEMSSEVAEGDITIMECSHADLLEILPKLTAENCESYRINDAGDIIRLKTGQVMTYDVRPIGRTGGYNYQLHIRFDEKSMLDKIIERLDLNDEQITELQEAIAEGLA